MITKSNQILLKFTRVHFAFKFELNKIMNFEVEEGGSELEVFQLPDSTAADG